MSCWIPAGGAGCCPECRLNYCSLDWDVHFAVNPGSHDCVIGTCPNGHRHLLG